MPEKDAAPGGLLAAVVAVQAKVGTLPKDATNPHFRSKYTPLDTIVEKVGPVLAEHGLAWQTFPTTLPDGAPALRYRLSHVSGEVQEDVMPLLLVKADPQGMGSALTYARRYSLCAVLNLVADEDEDGNAASTRASQERAAQEAAQATAKAKAGMSEEAKALLAEAEELAKAVPSLDAQTFARYKDATGYTQQGLLQLVEWLRKQQPAEKASAS